MVVVHSSTMYSNKESDSLSISNSVLKHTEMSKKSCCWIIQMAMLFVFFVNICIIMHNQNLWTKKETGNMPSFNIHEKMNQSIKNIKQTDKAPVSDYNVPTKNITIEAVSSKEHVSVSIDGLPVYNDVQARGIHLLVINQHNGNVMDIKTIDTNQPGNEMYMAEYLGSIREGMILVFAVRDEASLYLTEFGRRILRSLGSRYINDIHWRDTWIFVCQKKKGWITETLNKSPSLSGYGETAKINTSVSLDAKNERCQWGDPSLTVKREQFCFKYVGYDKLCDCMDPAPLRFQSRVLHGSRVSLAPIAIIASNRPHYLYQMLRKLLVTPGVEKKMITVYVDRYDDEVAALLDLLGIRVMEHVSGCIHFYCRINQSYKYAITNSFKNHPKADFVIILEEDLEVAEDIMDFFSQMVPVLLSDESVFCISAWNDNSFNHSSNDPAMAYRVQSMPGLGWVLKMTLWEKLEPLWPKPDYGGDWDMWMRMIMHNDLIPKARECIIPDVSRTFHLGKIGVHQNSYNDKLFKETSMTVLNKKTGNKFDITKLTKEGYENEIHRLLHTAQLLNHTKNPCNDTDFVPDTQGKIYVMYIKWAFKGDIETWMNLAKCLHLWHYDIRGFHNLMWRFWMKKNQILVVGSSSPYSVYKPNMTEPIVITDAMMGRKNDFQMLPRQGFHI